MPKEPTIMNFKEWRDRNPEIVDQEEEKEEDCEECDGSGIIECPHCGVASDCEDCNGTGKHTVVKNSAFLVYENERNKNMQAWKAWTCA